MTHHGIEDKVSIPRPSKFVSLLTRLSRFWANRAACVMLIRGKDKGQ